MNMTRLLLVFLLAASPAAILGATDGSTATVTGLLGLAQFSRGGGNYEAVKPGTVLQSGDLVQTATDSALDLDFGGGIGTIRLLQSTTLSLPTLSPANVQLHLKGGEILGDLQRRPAESKFQIEIPHGIVGVIEGEFRLNTRGLLVVLKGTALFVDTPAQGEPEAQILDAKSNPVYFALTEKGVRPAAKELEREVRAQMKARLPRK